MIGKVGAGTAGLGSHQTTGHQMTPLPAPQSPGLAAKQRLLRAECHVGQTYPRPCPTPFAHSLKGGTQVGQLRWPLRELMAGTWQGTSSRH